MLTGFFMWFYFCYQKNEYNATSMPQTISAPTANEFDVLNIFASISKPLVFLPFA